MALPNAFIIGVNKAGTTSVFNTLAQLPDVCGSRSKETHYFDPLRYGSTPEPLSTYEAQFSAWRGEPVVLEATPGYFYGGAVLARELRRIAPSSRAVVILRDPRRRAFSWWRFCRARQNLPTSLSFEEYLSRCEGLGLAPESSSTDVAWRGLSGGHYAHWLSDWQKAFGKDLLIEFYENLTTPDSGALARIAEHLGASATGLELARDNVSTEVVSQRAQSMALRLNRIGEALWRRYPRLKSKLRALYYRLNASGRQATLSDETLAHLTSHFAASNQALRELGVQTPASWESS